MLTSTNTPGGPTWLDVGSPDIETHAAYYTRLFGWTFTPGDATNNGYGRFKLGGRTIAGIGPLTEGASSGWTVYFGTRDADGTAKAVLEAGGSVRVEPLDVDDKGRMAAFTDPTGAEFAVWQPGEVTGLEDVNSPGSMSWLELYTTDAASAKDFYRAVFGWDIVDAPMGGEGLAYSIVSPSGGGPTTMHGGLMQLPPDNLAAGSTSEWHPYFEVADCDEAAMQARELGGMLLIPPMDVPMAGRIAMVLDPFGAVFALITSAPQQ
ncbi:VOC family protein [Yinghuangia seranimata]|uniref:VOC family protein n=1 Tax=Yinghuangia seranimata TaxID=408067 RepID=UPI00248B98A7|nr:VOC family protein [Yinghuangia seranimata]MDI2125797.1 VOC family protein [Yinghuangia seranimata]